MKQDQSDGKEARRLRMLYQSTYPFCIVNACMCVQVSFVSKGKASLKAV